MEISALVGNSAQVNPNGVAIRFLNEAVTFAEFDERIGRLAAGLVGKMGVKPRERIAFLGPNSIELLQIFFACARAGATFAPLSNRLSPEKLMKFLHHLGATLLIVDSQFEQISKEGKICGLREYF